VDSITAKKIADTVIKVRVLLRQRFFHAK